MKESQRKGLISVHVAVALFGFVGLFAKLVDLPAVIIVLGRVFFSSIFLWIFLRLKKQKIRLEEKSDYLWMVGAGAVLAIHWSSYMQSIQSSTVAVGTLTVSTFPIFVIFLEPYLFHEKLKKSDVFCTLMMLVGVFFIVPAFQMDNQITQGVLWGLLSAFTYAILSLMNRRFSSRYPATLVSLYEQGTATIVLIPMMFVLKPVITLADAGVLMMLGIIFTAVAHLIYQWTSDCEGKDCRNFIRTGTGVWDFKRISVSERSSKFQRVPWWCYHSGCCVFIDTETGGESI